MKKNKGEKEYGQWSVTASLIRRHLNRNLKEMRNGTI